MSQANTSAPSHGQSRFEQQRGGILISLIVLCFAAILAVDYLSPLGIAVWVFYLVPIALSFWLARPLAPLIVAFVANCLIVLTFFSDAPGIDRNIAQMNRIFGAVTCFGLGGLGYLFIHNRLLVERQMWLQRAGTGLSAAMRGEKELEELANIVMQFLAEYASAQVGALYVGIGDQFKLVGGYALLDDERTPKQITRQSGLTGQAIASGRTFLISDAPEGYLSVGSALGNAKPVSLLIAPTMASGVVNGVMEFGFLRRASPIDQELLDSVSESIGIAIRSALHRAELRNLLAETQRQAEELQAQGEELRVSNEELEEQSRALKESQVRLEEQQAELEQTNAQLEEQSQFLESQRDEVAKSKESLEVQTRELERASRFKSDFLANMSHELRTPLNSSLILAKLLADNPQGNLTEEQVRFAETIQHAGNDLLNLINDILDLSKIEAGRMDIHPEEISIGSIVGELKQVFEPLAHAKGLSFRVELDAACPANLVSDRQRMLQILKNILSNAIKFTETGSVTVTLNPDAKTGLAFAVRDTGIGIAPEHQRTIFEAFRQADGATNRKFGGTGLGLSIARELTRLLGGSIRLESESGKGSTFTLVLPLQYRRLSTETSHEHHAPWPEPASRSYSSGTQSSSQSSPPVSKSPQAALAGSPRVADDRETLTPERRLLLIIEDDASFSSILKDIGHEQGFQCLVANTAEQGLQDAATYRPQGVILDLGLPDQSGLTVLDRLKRDFRTRHIPIHVVSAHDYVERALSLGAVGYVVKPAKREELIHALQGIESRLDQRMRRVLIVEDDAVQLESLQKLLSSHDVEAHGARTAAECLKQLKESTFDCMVLDLSLPDATGYALLETLSREQEYSFPPAIVYTGRDLNSEEEQRLRRYSKSIIIKGAKSPERLLDEVALFLHQVVSDLPPAQQRMLELAQRRDATLEGRRILVVEDDVRNLFALTSLLEPRGVAVEIARNGKEALKALEKSLGEGQLKIDLVLMDVMMPEMDGLTATAEIRKRQEWSKLPIITLTAKAMKDDQEKCIAAGANDYLAKPLDIDKLLSLVRVWMPR